MSIASHRSAPARPIRRRLIVISALGGGGAERVAANLASAWAAMELEVAVLTLTGECEDDYQLDHRVQRVALDMVLGEKKGRWWGAARRLLILRRELRRRDPDVVVSFLERVNVQTLLAAAGLGVPVVVSERTDPRYCEVSPLTRILRWLTYRFASGLVVQTVAVAPWARQFTRPDRVHVIPNAAWPSEGCVGTERERTVVGLGRLVPVKGFDRLLRAFATSGLRELGWRLVVHGEGPDRQRLEDLAARLGVETAVTFPGRTDSPMSVLASAGIFALTSHYEGFPNVLLEAMVAGAPVISVDCPSGPAEMVENRVNGLLVAPEDAALAAGLRELATNEVLRRGLGLQARDVVRVYSPQRVSAMWEEVIQTACRTAGKFGAR